MEDSNLAREQSLMYSIRINKKDMDNNIMQVAKLKMQFYGNNKLRQFLMLCPWKKGNKCITK